MKTPNELYRPWVINGTYFNRMLQCGPRANQWLQHALIEYLPAEIFDAWKDKLAFLSTASSDAFRISKTTRLERELIFISEHIIPPPNVSEDHPSVRYLIFAALHEVVHAINQHHPPNEISEEANKLQEEEADKLAFDWCNAYVQRLNNPAFRKFTNQEISEAQKANRAKLQQLQ